MKILYRDADVTVCVKPPELLSEQTSDQKGLADLIALQNGGYVGVVHRLDRGVGGVMVYANNKHAAASLSKNVQEHKLKKEYLALIHGIPKESEGMLKDLLFHDRRQNKTFAVQRERAGVKEAILDYVTLKSATIEPYGSLSLVRISLRTGRTHQIRVQFSTRGYPLLGDGKYGATGDRCPIALYSCKLSFKHPTSGQQMTFEDTPNAEIWKNFLS